MRRSFHRTRHRVRTTAFFAGITLSISCRGGSDPAMELPHDQSAISSPYGAVLPPSEGRKLLHQCSRPTPSLVTGFWTPPASVIAEMEKRLSSVVPSLSTQRTPLDSLYYRQYVGLVRVNGKRTVYVNAIDKGL